MKNARRFLSKAPQNYDLIYKWALREEIIRTTKFQQCPVLIIYDVKASKLEHRTRHVCDKINKIFANLRGCSKNQFMFVPKLICWVTVVKLVNKCETYFTKVAIYPVTATMQVGTLRKK